MTPRVVVVGSSNTDMVVKLAALPRPGETRLGGDFVQVAGGKGANQAVAAARLGADVTFVARVGEDALGTQAIDDFSKDGISTRYVFRDSEKPTGVALIMVDQQGENVIAVASGANARLSPQDIDRAVDSIEEAAVLLMQLETPLEAVEHAARLGREKGKCVILNPAPAQPLADSLLRLISILTPNENEVEALTGVAPSDPDRAAEACRILLAKGVEAVVITLGPKGAYIGRGDIQLMVPVTKVEAVDTTAAGDAFNGALAYSIASGHPLRDAVEFANRVAAFSVTRLGAQPSLPARADLGLNE